MNPEQDAPPRGDAELTALRAVVSSAAEREAEEERAFPENRKTKRKPEQHIF